VSERNDQQSTPAKTCDGTHTMNFLIAGLRPLSRYTAWHSITNATPASGAPTEDIPHLAFTTGAVPANLPTHKAGTYPGTSRAEGVFLGGSLFTNFVATDLDGNLIW